MPAISVPNRPFASEMITGLALPDGIFETTIGLQRVNAHFKNQGASASPTVNIYVESVSDPGIVVTSQTYTGRSVQMRLSFFLGLPIFRRRHRESSTSASSPTTA